MELVIRTPRDVGAAIRARRVDLGWGQSELAEKVGVSRLWVNQVEAGKPGASLGLVLRTFKALGMNLTLVMHSEAQGTPGGPEPVNAVDINAIVDAARRKSRP